MNNVQVLYRASSGNVYNLKEARLLRIKDANFHNYEWTMDTTARRFGTAVDRFSKAAISYSVKFALMGSYDSRKDQLEELHADFERDIINESPGRLVWGDCYIDCYAVASSTYPDDENLRTLNDVKFYCPYPFWIQEKSISIPPLDETIVREIDKKYTATRYAYPYGYTINPIITWFNIDYYGRCDFKMTAFGPFSALYVTIGNNVYNIDYPADASEYMVVDSRASGNLKGQAYLVKANGQRVNVFDYRNPLYSLFQKVDPGDMTIIYPRTYGVDITFYEERSEPIEGISGANYAALLAEDGTVLTAKMGG